jgi:hypothetical protein
MINTMERLEPFTPAMPVSHILANYFQKLIRYWAKTNVRFLGDIGEDVLPMPVELCVRWAGNASGMLVIRCYDDFVKWLKKGKGYKPANLSSEKEILNEMVAQYGVYLIHNFWKSELLKIGPILTRPCRPEEWPARPATAAFSVLVEDHPVEIRLWLDHPA